MTRAASRVRVAQGEALIEPVVKKLQSEHPIERSLKRRGIGTQSLGLTGLRTYRKGLEEEKIGSRR